MMATTGFLACLVGAVVMGTSCGTGCSPAISLFLSSYVFHAEGDTRKSIGAFLKFFVGKAAAVILVCLAASVVGDLLIGENGYFHQYKLSFLMPLFLIGTGVYMLRRCWLEYRHKGCGHCSGGCCAESGERFQKVSPLIGGFLYGLTPCAPMIILAGYAVTMPLWEALTVAVVFSLSCTVSPLLLMLILMKLIAVKMQHELPTFFRVMKAVLSGAVLVMGCITLFTGMEMTI